MVVIEYSPDVDILTLFFAKATPGFVEYSAPALPSVLIDYTATNQIVSVVFEIATRTLRFSPQKLVYNKSNNIMTVLFVNSVNVTWKNSEIDYVVFGYEGGCEMKIVGLRILEADKHIAKSLSEEDALTHEQKAKEEIRAREGLWLRG